MGDNFNDNLKEARLRSGLSQKEVAENIGVAKSTYSLYESGNREPNVNTIKKIADCLNVSADTLLGLNDELTTLAAHFDGKEYTEDELNEIRQFAEFVKNKYGLNVSNLYIAQVKQEFGIIERINYNVGEGKARVPKCPQEKKDAIIDALKYYQMI